MERIQGDRADGFVYIDPDTQYRYRRDHISQGVSQYFGCVSGACGSRVIWRLGENLEHREPHNHEARPMEVALLRLKEVLRERAENEAIPLRNIFIAEQALHEDVALELGGFPGRIKKMMKRARKTGIPPIPGDLVEMNNSLRHPRYINRFSIELGPQARPFHRGLLKVHDAQIERTIYFVSPTVRQIVGRLNAPVHLHMDATFGVVPVAGGEQQLFTIQLLYEHSVSFPHSVCHYAKKNKKLIR